MEEQCTPYINIVPITRSPGGYRSWKTPTNFGRRTNRLSRLSSLPSLLSGILLRPPKANEKARTRSNVSPSVSATIIYSGSREFPKRFFRDYSSEIRRFGMVSWGESRESWKRRWIDRCALERTLFEIAPMLHESRVTNVEQLASNISKSSGNNFNRMLFAQLSRRIMFSYLLSRYLATSANLTRCLNRLASVYLAGEQKNIFRERKKRRTVVEYRGKWIMQQADKFINCTMRIRWYSREHANRAVSIIVRHCSLPRSRPYWTPRAA